MLDITSLCVCVCVWGGGGGGRGLNPLYKLFKSCVINFAQIDIKDSWALQNSEFYILPVFE